jgi:sugar lactone lactonase YvrE
MFWLTTVLLLGCTPPGTDDDGTVVVKDRVDPKDGDDDDDDDFVTLDSADTAPPVETGDTAPPTDCEAIPAGPVNYFTLTGYSTAEDFDFDGDGFAVSNYANNLVGKDQSGVTKVIKPNVGGWTAGTRVLATGDWVIADAGAGTMIRIDTATGAETVIATGMNYPNGVEVDDQNRVYVADQTQGNVRMVDAYTLEQWAVGGGMAAPNGVILSPDEQTLYVGSFGGGVIYAIDRITDTDWDVPRVLYDPQGFDGGFDGINVDECGNVYISEYTTGKIYRVKPDGTDPELMADLPSFWVPNMRWGVDVGGWEPDVLYVADRDQGRLFGVEMGVPGKKHLLAP